MRYEFAFGASILAAAGTMMAAMSSLPATRPAAAPSPGVVEPGGASWTNGTALPGSFVNWETPHVHPLELTPDGTRLLAVNTADNRLEVFDLASGGPRRAGSVPVGLDAGPDASGHHRQGAPPLARRPGRDRRVRRGVPVDPGRRRAG